MFVLETRSLLVVFFFLVWGGGGDGYGYMCIYAGILEPCMQYFLNLTG